MLKLFGVPRIVALVVVLALLGYVGYRIASVGRPQPVAILALVGLGYALVRAVLRLRHPAPEHDDE
jgi:hypothetical protein